MLGALVFVRFFFPFFTIVNRPEDLAEGTGADRLLMIIWKKGSEEQAFTQWEITNVSSQLWYVCWLTPTNRPNMIVKSQMVDSKVCWFEVEVVELG